MVRALCHLGENLKQRLTQKKLVLDEGVLEEEQELFSGGGKDNLQLF